MPPDVPPSKPNNPDLLKYLRFVDPNDPTKVVQIALQDTGLTTPDGAKIFSMGTHVEGSGGAGPAGTLPIYHDSSYDMEIDEVGMNTKSVIYLVGPDHSSTANPIKPLSWISKALKSLVNPSYEPTRVADTGISIGLHGIVTDTLVAMHNYSQIDPSDSFVLPDTSIMPFNRILGRLYHDFDDAEPGTITIVQVRLVPFNGTLRYILAQDIIVLNSSNNNGVAGRYVEFNIDTMAEYVSILIDNPAPNVSIHLFKLNTVGKVI